MAGREYREQADSPRRENDYDGINKSKRSPCYRHLSNLQRIRNEDPGVPGIIVLKTTVTTGSFLKLIKQTVNVDDSVVYAAVSPLCVHAHIRSFDPQMVAFSETSTIFPLFLTNTRPLY